MMMLRRCKVILNAMIYCVLLFYLLNRVLPGKQSANQYHNCLSQSIPYISNPLETAEMLFYTNNSFIRYGDSEVLLILGGSEPFQKQSQSLSTHLSRAFLDPDPTLMIGLYDCFSGFPQWRKGAVDWWHKEQRAYYKWVVDNYDAKRQYYSAMLSSTYVHTFGTQCALLEQIYHTLREIWRGKDIVLVKGDNGQHFDYDVYDTARSKRTYIVPRYHAWNVYEIAKVQLLNEPIDKLFILTAGPLSRVLVYDLAKSGRRALDLGHLAKDYDFFMKAQQPVPHIFYERDEVVRESDASNRIYIV